VLLVLDHDALSGSLAQDLRDAVLLLLAGSGCYGPPQLGAEQRVEWLGQLPRDRVLVIDQQALEEREVELPSEGVGCFPVGRHAVADPRERALEVALGLQEVALDLSQAAFSAVYLPRQPFLLAPK
jgi:hypothetical protein